MPWNPKLLWGMVITLLLSRTHPVKVGIPYRKYVSKIVNFIRFPKLQEWVLLLGCRRAKRIYFEEKIPKNCFDFSVMVLTLLKTVRKKYWPKLFLGVYLVGKMFFILLSEIVCQ